MPVPWLAVGKLVLANLDTIIGVVKPAFTRKKVEALPSQTDLLNQQIAELQAAASSNADQVKQLASQVKEVVAALEQAATDARGATLDDSEVVDRRAGDRDRSAARGHRFGSRVSGSLAVLHVADFVVREELDAR